ncbi:MAG: hypothetical protein U1F87_08170 [Kiritimatiellia bacterium]
MLDTPLRGRPDPNGPAHHRHPEPPWLTRAANERLLALTGPRDTVLEFGAGRSTLFFARRCARVESVEHNAEW